MAPPVPQNMVPTEMVVIVDGTTGLPIQFPLVVSEQGQTGAIPAGANATAINTNGTTVVNTNSGGLYWGLYAQGLGTLWTAAVYDVSGTSSKVLAASVSVGALGALGLAAPPGVPVKVNGTLVVVTAGTLAGLLNALWN